MIKFHRTGKYPVTLSLFLACVFSTPWGLAETPSAEREEVARLLTILRSHYAEESGVAPSAAAEAGTSVQAVELQGKAYPSALILLSGTQGIKALEEISLRLADDSIPAQQRRDTSVIFHVEVHNNEKLLSSRSHSLKPLGKGQYITKVSLAGGQAVISLRQDKWTINLAIDDETDYLVTLNARSGQRAELHLIPVPKLKATYWSDPPPWLPPIGEMPSTASGS